MKSKVWVTPFGGHGTTAIKGIWYRREWAIHTRPDWIFSYGIDTYDINSYPVWDEKFKHHHAKGQLLYHRGNEWKRRTLTEPQPDKTISENMLEFIDGTQNDVLLFGKQSLSEPWLTRHGIKNTILMVRHPLDAYDSLFGRQHPKWGKLRGGVQSILAAEFWCKQWNKVVEDFLSTGNPIYRYEHFASDLRRGGEKELANLLASAWYSRPRREFTTPETEEYIKQLTWHNFKAIYKNW